MKRLAALSFSFVITLAFACGDTTDPTPVDAGVDAPVDASDASLPPIACGDLMCSGATPNCLTTHICGFGPSDCTSPTLDGGACPESYTSCTDPSGKAGCLSLYTYSCTAGSSCEQISPRHYGNCNC